MRSPEEGLKPIRFDPSFTAEFPGASREAAESMTNVVRTTTELLAELDRRRRAVSHLSAAAIQVLAIVEDDPLPPHVIVDRMLVTSGTMTSLLDRLETKAWCGAPVTPTTGGRSSSRSPTAAGTSSTWCCP